MEQIQIDNPYLREYIRKKLDLPRYQSSYFDFNKAVEEALVRRQYVLGLSPEEFIEDLENLNEAIKIIAFSDDLPENCFAVHSPSEEAIYFNINSFIEMQKTYSKDEFCQTLIESLTHELEHAMQEDKKTGTNRASVYNEKTKHMGNVIFELAAQGVASRCSFSRTYNEMRNHESLSAHGYTNEMFAIPLIAAAFGISEITVLKYFSREREKLFNACDKNISDKPKTAELLQRIEDELEMIHSIYYPAENQKEFLKLSDLQKITKAKMSYINLIKLCEEVLAERIVHLPCYYDPDAVSQLQYDRNKLLGTIQDTNKKFYAFFNTSDLETNQLFESDSNFLYFQKALRYLIELGETKNRDLMPYSPEIIASIKNGLFDACQKHGLQEQPNIDTLKNTAGFLDKVIMSDYNDFLEWDNSEVYPSFLGKTANYAYTSKPKFDINLVPNAMREPDFNSKINDLRIALLATELKYSTDSKYALSQMFSSKAKLDDSYYSLFTRDIPDFDKSEEQISPRDRMQRSFNTDKDRVFLADIIARNYIYSAFSADRKLYPQNDASLKIMQSLLSPTISQYGDEESISILKDIILNDDYSKVVGDTEKDSLAILGKKQILDIALKPFYQTFLYKREISPEKKHALQYAIVETNAKYPNSIHYRLASIIKEFKDNKSFSYAYFTSCTRESFKKEFSSSKDMEDLIGLLCDTYCRQYYFRKNAEDPLQQMLNKCGPDYFRENIIRTQLYGDYTGLLYGEHKETLQNVDLEKLMQKLSIPFINEAIQSNYYEQLGPSSPSPVTRANITEIATDPSVLRNIKNVFGNINYSIQMSRTPYQPNNREASTDAPHNTPADYATYEIQDL